MTIRLDGKTALVTAAGQGIGRASAIAFAEAGATVYATDINEQLLAALPALPNLKTAKLDVLDDVAVKACVEKIGTVDILFNCAGVVHGGSVLEMKDSDLDFAFDLNVKAMIRTIRAVLPGMLAKQDGAIINMSSVASSVKGVPNRFAYGVTKAAVIGLTKSVAADYMRAQGNYDEARAAFIARQPMGRLGTPEEIADLAVYLAAATYTSGQACAIDGGWTI